MMTSENPQQGTGKKKRSRILGLVAVCLLIGGVAIWFQPASPNSTSSPATIQINLPKTEYPTIPPSAPAFTVSIESVGSSEITGTVTFKDIAGTVAILLHLDLLPEEKESEESPPPVELHYGTCAVPGSLAYPMNVPDAGESETDLPIDLQELNTQRPLAVILYRSAEDRTVIACGDVP